MTSFNKVILIGNLTRDPELRYTPNGNAVASLPLAINHRYRQGEETREDVCYVDVVVFGKQAESCSQYLTRGGGVIVDGRLSQRRWEAEDGTKRSKHEVVAQSVRFMPRRQETMAAGEDSGRSYGGNAAAQGSPGGMGGAGNGGGSDFGPPDFTDDDIPF
ncbi:MAG: single-stranded DNA-binding protein [Nitrospirota bacterium]|nr:single-stranded DNA-binding protein [Nitrospirota bacterium]